MTKRRIELPVLKDWEILPGLPPGGRDECRRGVRPCPYVQCSQNVWMLTSVDMPGRRHNGKSPPSTLRVTGGNNCTLDHSTKEHSAAYVGRQLGMSTRRVEQELAAIAKKMKDSGGDLEVVRSALECLGLDPFQAAKSARALAAMEEP